MKEIKGNLITLAQDGMFDVIIHGNNCFCEMGAGIAKELSDLYPEVLIEDMKTIVGDERKLSHFTSVKVSDGFVVVNAYTQYEYGSGLHADYDAIRKFFNRAKEWWGTLRIGYPLIGAGLAGGDWKRISKIIDQELVDVDHTLVRWDGTYAEKRTQEKV